MTELTMGGCNIRVGDFAEGEHRLVTADRREVVNTELWPQLHSQATVDRSRSQGCSTPQADQRAPDSTMIAAHHVGPGGNDFS
jgi:hypothetical protein